MLLSVCVICDLHVFYMVFVALGVHVILCTSVYPVTAVVLRISSAPQLRHVGFFHNVLTAGICAGVFVCLRKVCKVFAGCLHRRTFLSYVFSAVTLAVLSLSFFHAPCLLHLTEIC